MEGAAPAAHGNYRARPREGIAVLTTSALPPLPGGTRYVGWAHVAGKWISFGSIALGADGRSLSVMEDPVLGATPDEIQVTRERSDVAAPTGPVVVAWP